LVDEPVDHGGSDGVLTEGVAVSTVANERVALETVPKAITCTQAESRGSIDGPPFWQQGASRTH
jgi:hypothetical protein